jgi:hypothetical protein
MWRESKHNYQCGIPKQEKQSTSSLTIQNSPFVSTLAIRQLPQTYRSMTLPGFGGLKRISFEEQPVSPSIMLRFSWPKLQDVDGVITAKPLW